MKSKISVTVDLSTLVKISEQVRSGKFRNKSHLVEYAVLKLLKDEQNISSIVK